MKKLKLIDEIKLKIIRIRGIEVMIDKDLSYFYDIGTKRLNEQVKRNIDRFPKEFMFQLTKEEKEEVVANCDHLSSLKFSPNLPYVFTEQGIAMLSSILNSKTAIHINIQIIKSFISMRKFLSNNNLIINRLNNLEKEQIITKTNFDKIFNLIENKLDKEEGIFFEGQLFDSYLFVTGLIKKAKNKIILIDNFIDETTLNLFTKRKIGVKVIIYTKKLNLSLRQDLKKYNSQYEEILIKEFKLSHDRFLIIDDSIYLIGASLKDLGKKWFGFSKIDYSSLEIMKRLEE